MKDFCKDCPWIRVCGKESTVFEHNGRRIEVDKDEYPCHGTLDDMSEVEYAKEVEGH